MDKSRQEKNRNELKMWNFWVNGSFVLEGRGLGKNVKNSEQNKTEQNKTTMKKVHGHWSLWHSKLLDKMYQVLHSLNLAFSVHKNSWS